MAHEINHEVKEFTLDNLEIPLPTQIPQIKQEAFHSISSDFVNTATKNSEASKIAIAVNVMAFFCATIGRCICQWIGDNKIHCRPFFLIVGKSGKARKGTAEALPKRVFQRVDELLREKEQNHLSLNVHSGGLSSGEGIGYAIRDPSTDGTDQGIVDKRLLVIEPEFSNVLANCRRETSTLSAVIRNLFDGRDLSPLTKTNRTRATKPHVVIVSHTTIHELMKKIGALEINNGLLNRFLICFVQRERFMPLPEKTKEEDIDRLANWVVTILEFIDNEVAKQNGELEIAMSDEAKQVWEKVYPVLSSDTFGDVGVLLARSEVYARMLAMIFTLLDKKTTIEICHIKAAIYWIDYCGASVRYLFQKAQESQIEQLSDTIISLLQKDRQMTRTEINNALNRHTMANEIAQALEHLLTQSPPRISQTKEETNGRPKVIYKLCEISVKSEES